MHLKVILFIQTWPWWAGGLGLGLTALAMAWITGKKLGVTSYVESACSLATPTAKGKSPVSFKSLWFLLGLPLGGLLANLGHWNWTWLYGRMDGLSMGSFAVKAVLLFIGGALVGFGARWAGGCTSGFSLMGVSRLNWMALLSTLGFLVSGSVVAHLLYQVFF